VYAVVLKDLTNVVYTVKLLYTYIIKLAISLHGDTQLLCYRLVG